MNRLMRAAFEEAQAGAAEGGVPIGCAIVHDGQIVGRGHNRRVQLDSAILHAEIDALQNMGRRSAAFYRECVLYTTLSPCVMCSGAVLLYRIPHVVVGEHSNFVGAETLLRGRGVQVDVLGDPDCAALMAGFIKSHPDVWNEDIGEP